MSDVRMSQAMTNNKPRVLIIEDAADIRGWMEVMQPEGFTITTTATAETGLELYRGAKVSGDPFALIVVDMKLGEGLTGIDVIEQVRAEDAAVRICILTGNDSPGMAYVAGVYHVLERWNKPLDPHDLMDNIMRILELPEPVAQNGGERRKGMADVQKRMRLMERTFTIMALLLGVALFIILFLMWRQNDILVHLDALMATRP